MPLGRTVPPGMHPRVPPKRMRVAAEPERRKAPGDASRGIATRAQPVDDAQRAAMHDLVTLETRRREMLRDQERKAHALQTQRSLEMEEALRNERKLAQENRAPGRTRAR